MLRLLEISASFVCDGCKLAKLSACIAKCMTTINKIHISFGHLPLQVRLQDSSFYFKSGQRSGSRFPRIIIWPSKWQFLTQSKNELSAFLFCNSIDIRNYLKLKYFKLDWWVATHLIKVRETVGILTQALCEKSTIHNKHFFKDQHNKWLDESWKRNIISMRSRELTTFLDVNIPAVVSIGQILRRFKVIKTRNSTGNSVNIKLMVSTVESC